MARPMTSDFNRVGEGILVSVHTRCLSSKGAGGRWCCVRLAVSMKVGAVIGGQGGLVGLTNGVARSTAMWMNHPMVGSRGRFPL